VDDLLRVLDTLVGFDTTSRESNLPLIDWLANRYEGVADAIIRVPDDTGDKAGLLVRFGPDKAGGVVLSGHTDCVPVDEQAWASDPFRLRREKDRVHGRGTADMKGFLAVCTVLAPTFAAADLDKPIWFAFTYDEEVGTLGAPAVAQALEHAGADPRAVIIGEPTMLQVVTAHKGIRSFRLTILGEDGHSSRPGDAANAVAAAARIATFIDDLARKKAEEDHQPFDPPYTTFNLAKIHGGTAINIVPNRCVLEFEYRPVPDDDSPVLRNEILEFATEEILPDLKVGFADASIEFEDMSSTPALAPERNGAAEAVVRRITGNEDPAGVVSYGTDGSHFQAAGWSTVVWGPGSIDVAHRPDEYIPLDQLDRCRDALANLPTT
jgi:acetylornithine deacetylase